MSVPGGCCTAGNGNTLIEKENPFLCGMRRPSFVILSAAKDPKQRNGIGSFAALRMTFWF
jgi:hypothetical protein